MQRRTHQLTWAIVLAWAWTGRAVCCAQGYPGHEPVAVHSVPEASGVWQRSPIGSLAPSPIGAVTPSPIGSATPSLPSGSLAPSEQAADWAYPMEDCGNCAAPFGWLETPRRSYLGLPYSDPDAPGRHVGWGQPLVGTSWLNRPLHLGWLVGTVVGDDLIDGVVGQEADLFGGYRIGWDFDHYWGLEYRLAFARPDVQDVAAASSPRIVRHWYSDFHLLHYPWGDSRWRPFLSVGLGWASFEFTDAQETDYDETLFHVPIGAGVKYYVGKWMSLRLDVTDNLALAGSGLDTMHNLSISFGVDGHFGPGTHRKYGY